MRIRTNVVLYRYFEDLVGVRVGADSGWRCISERVVVLNREYLRRVFLLYFQHDALLLLVHVHYGHC